MDLSNLKIHFLGDSITAGYWAETTETSYVGRFQAQYPNAIIRNYGVCGSCISNKCVWDSEDMRTRAKRMETDADLIVIFGGTNDFHCMTPLGTPEERSADTFFGAYNLLLDDLVERYPNTKIVLCTILPRFDETWPERDGRVRVAPLSDYVAIVKQIGQLRNLPVVDLFSIEDLREPIPGEKSPLTKDGLHPLDAGHALIFDRIHQALLRL